MKDAEPTFSIPGAKSSQLLSDAVCFSGQVKF